MKIISNNKAKRCLIKFNKQNNTEIRIYDSSVLDDLCDILTYDTKEEHKLFAHGSVYEQRKDGGWSGRLGVVLEHGQDKNNYDFKVYDLRNNHLLPFWPFSNEEFSHIEIDGQYLTVVVAHTEWTILGELPWKDVLSLEDFEFFSFKNI